MTKECSMTNEEPYCERLAGGFLRPNRAITPLRLVFQTQPRSGDGGRDIFTGKGGVVKHERGTQECTVKRTGKLPGTLAYAYVRLNTLICGGARSGRAEKLQTPSSQAPEKHQLPSSKMNRTAFAHICPLLPF